MAEQRRDSAVERGTRFSSRFTEMVMRPDEDYLVMCARTPREISHTLFRHGNVGEDNPVRGAQIECTTESPDSDFRLDGRIYFDVEQDELKGPAWIDKFVRVLDQYLYAGLGCQTIPHPRSRASCYAQLSPNRYVRIDFHEQMKTRTSNQTTKYQGATLSTLSYSDYLAEIGVEPSAEEIESIFFIEDTPEERLDDVKRFMQIWAHVRDNAVGMYSADYTKKLYCAIIPLEPHIAVPEQELRTEKPLSFDDIAGYEIAKQKLLDLALLSEYPAIAKNIGLKKGQGIFLYGPPGTGKTTLAEAFSHEIDAEFIQFHVSEIIEKWVGRSARNLDRKIAEIKRKAEAPDAKIVLFMDEVDSLGADASRIHGERADTVNRLKSHILDLLANHHNIIVVAATNHEDKVDKALFRTGRFEKIEIGLPSEYDRSRILALMLGKLAADAVNNRELNPGLPTLDFDHSINVPELAASSYGLVGADFDEILQELRRRRLREYVAATKRAEITGEEVAAISMSPITQPEIMDLIAEYIRKSDTV